MSKIKQQHRQITVITNQMIQGQQQQQVSSSELYGGAQDTTKKGQPKKMVEGGEKFVVLEVTTEQTGYTLQKVYGHPNTQGLYNKVTTWQPAVVVPTYRANLILYDEELPTKFKKHQLNITRDAWYYLSSKNGLDYCTNIAFEPKEEYKNTYYTEEIHFPQWSSNDCKGYFLLQADSPKGERYLEAESVKSYNQMTGKALADAREYPEFAHNVMFHMGGFYSASIHSQGQNTTLHGLHKIWLGGSEGCFTFIPVKSLRATPDEASKITLEDAFISNKTWIEWTTIIARHRNKDPKKRFIVRVDKRSEVTLDQTVKIIRIEPKMPEYVPVDGTD